MTIDKVRSEKGWTQQELADALGVTVQTVRNWESGRTHPGKRSQDIAKVLGCEISLCPLDEIHNSTLSEKIQTGSEGGKNL
jgi:transcriptional regulator with XRE-family HTH domain